MQTLTKLLVALSVFAFVLAVISAASISGNIAGIAPEGYSRPCSNFALIDRGLRFCVGREESS